MKRNCAKRCVCAGLCLCLFSGLWACSRDLETPSSSTPESSAPQSSSQISSEPESSWFVPAQDLIPSSPQEGSEGFEAAFSQNPIDREYDRAYGEAASFSTLRQACDEAAESWKGMVDTAFQAALDAAPEEEQADLQDQQDAWERGLEKQLQEIQDAAGDGNDGILEAARQTVLLYRQRAMELCRIKYDADGELPPFPGEGETAE